MKTSTDNNQLKQLLILSISSGLVFIVLGFCIWLYMASKQETTQDVLKRTFQIQAMVDGLADIKKKELNALAISLANGPVLRGSLQTEHTKTIEDILSSIQKKNEIDFALILRGKNLVYSSLSEDQKDLSLKEIAASHFIGKTKFKSDALESYSLVLGRALREQDLNFWSKITQAKFLIKNKDDKAISSNLSSELEVKRDPNSELQVTKDNTFYWGEKRLLRDTLKVYFFIDKKIYWENFQRKKNSLIILGASILFIGLLLSLLLANIIIKFIEKSQTNQLAAGNTDDFQKIILEIEGLKKKLL